MGGGDNKYYFRTLSGLYYFDDDRNVYYADGALLHGASLDLQLGDLIDLGFHIDGVLYWFDEVGLMSQDSSGIPYCVRALRREELDQLDLYQTLGGLQAPQDDFPSLSNLPRVEFNDPTHPNCIKRKREEDAPGQSVSIKISASHNVGGEPEGSGPGQNVSQTILLVSGCENMERLAITLSISLFKPQQNPRPRDSEVTPMPTLEKYYFCASGRAYYFDHCRGLYSEDDRLLYDGSSSFQNAISLPNFYIDEVPYWFESDGLSYRDASGRRCRVHAWLSKQNQLDHYFPLAPNQRSTHQINVATIQLSSNFGFCDDPESVSVLKAMLTSDGCRGSLNGKTDIPSQNVTLNPPQRGLQLGTAVQSQSSSTTKSPSDISASNPNQLSEEQPLFADSEPSVIQDIGNISTLHHATTEPQGGDDDRPVKKRKRGEPILCPECGKECRRPVALREHLRTHTGKKPEICPFDKCNRGFATRSNMRRHFLEHRIGPMESYLPVYICPFVECSENFTSQLDVIQHFLVHQMGPLEYCSPIYTCPFERYNEKCNEKFTTQQDVIQHALGHPPDRRRLSSEIERS